MSCLNASLTGYKDGNIISVPLQYIIDATATSIAQRSTPPIPPIPPISHLINGDETSILSPGTYIITIDSSNSDNLDIGIGPSFAPNGGSLHISSYVNNTAIVTISNNTGVTINGVFISTIDGVQQGQSSSTNSGIIIDLGNINVYYIDIDFYLAPNGLGGLILNGEVNVSSTPSVTNENLIVQNNGLDIDLGNNSIAPFRSKSYVMDATNSTSNIVFVSLHGNPSPSIDIAISINLLATQTLYFTNGTGLKLISRIVDITTNNVYQSNVNGGNVKGFPIMGITYAQIRASISTSVGSDGTINGIIMNMLLYTSNTTQSVDTSSVVLLNNPNSTIDIGTYTDGSVIQSTASGTITLAVDNTVPYNTSIYMCTSILISPGITSVRILNNTGVDMTLSYTGTNYTSIYIPNGSAYSISASGIGSAIGICAIGCGDAGVSAFIAVTARLPASSKGIYVGNNKSLNFTPIRNNVIINPTRRPLIIDVNSTSSFNMLYASDNSGISIVNNTSTPVSVNYEGIQYQLATGSPTISTPSYLVAMVNYVNNNQFATLTITGVRNVSLNYYPPLNNIIPYSYIDYTTYTYSPPISYLGVPISTNNSYGSATIIIPDLSSLTTTIIMVIKTGADVISSIVNNTGSQILLNTEFVINMGDIFVLETDTYTSIKISPPSNGIINAIMYII